MGVCVWGGGGVKVMSISRLPHTPGSPRYACNTFPILPYYNLHRQTAFRSRHTLAGYHIEPNNGSMQNETGTRERFEAIIVRLDGAYAYNTIRAYYADMDEFITYCREHGHEALPATPESVAAFIESTISNGIKSSSIKRKLSSISSIHQLGDVADPTGAPVVQLAMRKVFRSLGKRFTPAYPVTRPLLDRLLLATGDDLRGLRDRALLLLAYDSLRRRQELTSLCIEELEYHGDEAVVRLRKSKSDLSATGHWIHLHAESTAAVKAWLEAAELTEGFILRGLTTGNQVTPGLGGRQLSRIVNALAQKAGFGPEILSTISGNSMRVGAAQDLLRTGSTLVQIMQKGGWEKTDTLSRYLERHRTPGMVCEDEAATAPVQDTAARMLLETAVGQMEGAYASATLRAYRSHMEAFIGYCEARNQQALPADSPTVAAFLMHLSLRDLSSRTIRKWCTAISAVHLISGFADPAKGSDTRLALRTIYTKLGRGARQAYGITGTMLERMLEACGEGMAGLRDRALLLLAYDSLRRRQELVILQAEDLLYRDTGAVVLLRRSKTDQYGAGHWIHLQENTARALKRWTEAAGITEGFILRGFNRQGGITEKLDPDQLTAIYKRLAQAAGFEERIVEGISSHSMRVGAAQDLLQSGATLQEIMQKGGWEKVDTVMHYIERTRPPGLICEDEEL
jgi:site-specific recombinase XerD